MSVQAGGRGYEFSKRLLDVLVGLIGLILAAPVLGLASLFIGATMGRPVLFRQARPGLGGRPFTLYKLRTMREEVDAAGAPLPDGARLTRLGGMLRRASLDELPQLWNVLRGDMSLVGPRPLLIEYLPLYSAEQARRHEVRPGVTGWAQVQGRNAVAWEERLRLDVWYVDHRNLMLDLWILGRTLAAVLSGRGVRQEGSVTMEPFRGSHG